MLVFLEYLDNPINARHLGGTNVGNFGSKDNYWKLGKKLLPQLHKQPRFLEMVHKIVMPQIVDCTN